MWQQGGAIGVEAAWYNASLSRNLKSVFLSFQQLFVFWFGDMGVLSPTTSSKKPQATSKSFSDYHPKFDPPPSKKKNNLQKFFRLSAKIRPPQTTSPQKNWLIAEIFVVFGT